jgi:Domain of unknown function (DUF4166)
LDFLVVVGGEGLAYEQRGAALRLGRLRLSIPRRVAPSVRARVEARGERCFFVRVDAHASPRLPLFSYYGVMEEE